MSICLTYDNSFTQDGAGAQIQRILAIESLALHLGVGYMHSEILNIDSNYGDGLNTIASKEKFLLDLNSFFDFHKFTCRHKDHTMIRISMLDQLRSYGVPFLKLLSFLSHYQSKHFVIAIRNVNDFVQRIPWVYELCRGIHARKTPKLGTTLSVKVHLPWAGLGSGLLKDRFISVTWYRNILERLSFQAEKRGLSVNVTFHTDAIPGLKPKNWTSELGISSQTRQYWEKSNLLNSNIMNLSYLDFEKEFSFLPSFEVKFGITPIQVWEDMSMGHVQILAKSSLSYVSGLISPNALKFLNPISQTITRDFIFIDDDWSLLDREFDMWYKTSRTK